MEFEEGGKIILIVGPMFSGKSTKLMKQIKISGLQKKSTCIVKFDKDKRYSNQNKLVTHDKIECPAISANKLGDVLKELMNFEVIGIDEGQFYEDVVEKSNELANLGKIVYISALSGSFKMEPFPNISRLISKADKVIHLKSVCDYCGEKAGFTLRTTNDSHELIVGGSEMYKPACRKCFNEKHKC